jgi:hypothetical protein
MVAETRREKTVHIKNHYYVSRIDAFMERCRSFTLYLKALKTSYNLEQREYKLITLLD